MGSLHAPGLEEHAAEARPLEHFTAQAVLLFFDFEPFKVVSNDKILNVSELCFM